VRSLLGASLPLAPPATARRDVPVTPAASPAAMGNRRLIAVILFTTGFTSMGMEVALTRAFTAVLQTHVYAFASLLFTYLVATWLGSLWYRRHLASSRVLPTARLLAWLAVTATLPVLLNDPRLHYVAGPLGPDAIDVLRFVTVFASLLPFCGLLGYLTPKLIDSYSGGSPDTAGFSYALNVLGCILGPLAASYLLLPLLGIKAVLVLLAAPYAVLLCARRLSRVLASHVAVGLWRSSSSTRPTRTACRVGRPSPNHSATVTAYGEGMKRPRQWRGRPPRTIPRCPLPWAANPTVALVICFGMGTTTPAMVGRSCNGG
jgi:hypothetical protein